MGVFTEEREKKFTAIYRSYVDEIYQFIYLRTGLREAAAEDLTQEIFVAAFRGISGFRGVSSERTWIFGIARNKLNDYYRKQYSARFEWTEIDDDLAEQLDDPTQDIEDRMIESYESEKIRSSFADLPEIQRIVLILKYLDDRSVKDIANIVGKTPKAVESVLQRAKKAFIRSYRQITTKEAGNE